MLTWSSWFNQGRSLIRSPRCCATGRAPSNAHFWLVPMSRAQDSSSMWKVRGRTAGRLRSSYKPAFSTNHTDLRGGIFREPEVGARDKGLIAAGASFVLTLDEALRAGAIVRGMDLEEDEVKLAEQIAAPAREPRPLRCRDLRRCVADALRPTRYRPSTAPSAPS